MKKKRAEYKEVHFLDHCFLDPEGKMLRHDQVVKNNGKLLNNYRGISSALRNRADRTSRMTSSGWGSALSVAGWSASQLYLYRTAYRMASSGWDSTLSVANWSASQLLLCGIARSWWAASGQLHNSTQVVGCESHLCLLPPLFFPTSVPFHSFAPLLSLPLPCYLYVLPSLLHVIPH